MSFDNVWPRLFANLTECRLLTFNCWVAYLFHSKKTEYAKNS